MELLPAQPPLPARYARELGAAGLGVACAVLGGGEAGVAHALRVSAAHAREVVGAVARAAVAPDAPLSCLDLMRRDRAGGGPGGRWGAHHLPTGLPHLDAALRGGLPPSLTELCGPAGVGKTQWCLTLTAAAVAVAVGVASGGGAGGGGGGEGGSGGGSGGGAGGGGGGGPGVVFVDTEGSFDAARLQGLMRARSPDVYGRGSDGGDDDAEVRVAGCAFGGGGGGAFSAHAARVWLAG